MTNIKQRNCNPISKVDQLLEKYHDNKIFSDDQLGEIQSVIIPAVLDIVIEDLFKPLK